MHQTSKALIKLLIGSPINQNLHLKKGIRKRLSPFSWGFLYFTNQK